MKGESSFWFNNKSGFQSERLAWQDDYFAVSVSESMIKRVRAYIDRQVKHHRKRSFELEYEDFMKKYGFLVKS
jgi:REP element-mobilizing transposase RayT